MKRSINVMPASLCRQQLARRRLAQWSKVLVGLVVVGWAAYAYQHDRMQVLQQRLEVVAREHRPTQSMLQELIAMRDQLVEIEQQQRVAHELEQRRHVLAVLGIVSQAARRTEGALRVTKLEIDDFQNRQTTLGTGSTTSGGARVLVSGAALDNSSVAELLDALQDSGYFRRVELLALKEQGGGDTTMRDYQMRCEL